MKAQSSRMQLSAKLKTWRATHGLPLKTVATDLKISESTWQRWEKGQRTPATEYLLDLSDYLMKPVCWLLSDVWPSAIAVSAPFRQWQGNVGTRLPTGKK